MTVDAINTGTLPAPPPAVADATARQGRAPTPASSFEAARAPAEEQALAAPRQQPLETDPSALVDAIESLRDDLNAKFRSVLRIDRNEEAGRFTYSLVDPQTDETRYRWPPQNYVELIAFLRNPEGGFVDRSV